MMAIASEQQTVDLREPSGWRRSKNQIATVGMWVAFVVMLVPLGFVLFTVISKGASAISWQFLTNGTIPSERAAGNVRRHGGGRLRHAGNHGLRVPSWPSR